MEKVQGNTGAAKEMEPAANTQESAPAAETGAATAQTTVTETGTATGQEESDAQPVVTEHPRTLMQRLRVKIEAWDDDLHEELHDDLLAVERLLGIVD